MTTWLIKWSLERRALVIALWGMVAVAGALSALNINLDAFPDTTPVQIQINTMAPAFVPEEVELQITFPVELAMGGIPRLEQMRSISMFGLSQVVLTFKDGTDIYFARQLINERLNSLQMPEGIDKPEMGPVSTGLGEVLHYLVSRRDNDQSDEALTELRTIHDWRVKPALRPVDGTAEVNSWGGYEKQYQIRLDPTRLVRHDVTFEQVVEAVKANNLNVGGGNINRNDTGDMLLVHGIGRTVNTREIETIVVDAHGGVPIYVRDVADVSIGHEIRRGIITAQGQGEAVLGLGFMRMGENSYTFTQRLNDKLGEVAKTLPENVAVKTVYNRTELVDQVINTVRSNLLDGAILVIIIVYIFLGNLRAGLIVAAAIPLSMMFAFTGMWKMAIAGSLLSLGAIDFGIVVDSSVIVMENIVRHIAHGAHAGEGHGPPLSRIDVVRNAAIEVRQPAMFGQIIIMIVYLPILSLQGIEGKMFRPMAFTVIFLLIGSLLAALTLIPVLSSLFLPKHLEERDPLLVRVAQWLYGPALRFCLKQRYAIVAASLAFVGYAGWLFAHTGSEFVPRLSEGAIVVGSARMPGTDLDESIRMNSIMERIIRDNFPDEVRDVWSRTGSPEVPTDASGVEMTDHFVMLTPRATWKKAKTQTELVGLMEKELIGIPGQVIWFTQPIEQRLNEMVSGVRSDIALKLFAQEFDDMLTKAAELEKLLRTVPGCADLQTEKIAGQPILQVRIDADAVARYGVPRQRVLDLVESIGTKPLGTIIEGQLRFPLAIRLPEEYRRDPHSIGAILVATPSGERIPLSRLATINVVEGPRLISRETMQRRIIVQCNVRGRDVGSFVAEAQEKIAAQINLPADKFRLEWGGQFENLQRAKVRLGVVVPIALGLIVALLFLSYRNAVDTICLFLSVPFAWAGGIFTLWTQGMPFSISAAVGFITLSGVSVLNKMVFVTAFRQEQAEGRTTLEAVPSVAMIRLRTVIMTTLVAVVGFSPMAISTGVGAEVQRPLAAVVIGGVIASALMELFLFPVIYYFVGDFAKPKLIAEAQAEAALPHGAHPAV
jgi:cobalt-zinc-cadmium resistance protein CzcA